MIPTWTIWLDGAAYSGETAQKEHAMVTAERQEAWKAALNK